MIVNRKQNAGPGVKRSNGWVLKASVLFLFSLWASALPAQEVWTLDSILYRIRTGNPELAVYDYQARAREAYAGGAQSWEAPWVGAGTYMTPYSRGEQAGDRGMFMLSAEQPIPNPAKLRAKENYMKSRADIVAAGRGEAYNALRAQARNIYYEWVVLEKKKTVLEENLALMQTLLQLAEIRYPYSRGSLGNIYKAEARLHEVENMLLMNRHDIRERNITLNTLMNIPEDTRYRIDTSMRDREPMLVAVDSAYLLENRSDLQRIGRSITTLRLAADLEKANRKPEFSLRYEHMMPYNGLMESRYTLMGMVSIPIAPWASKSYKASIAGKQIEITALKKKREAVLNRAQGAVANIRHHYHIMREQLENYNRKIIPALRKNYETTRLSYEQNQEELPVVIDAWEALNAGQMQYLDQLEMYYETIVSYEKELER